MTLWEQYDVTLMVERVLRHDVPDTSHHLGRPYITAYQLATLVHNRYPEFTEALGRPIGGGGVGGPSLAGYLARGLSRKIRSGEITFIEGRWFFSWDPMTFGGRRSTIRAASHWVSMFRLAD